MRLRKWVDFGQEVEVEIGLDDVRSALAEAFDNVTRDRLGENGPNQCDVLLAINCIGTFFNALTDEQVNLLTSTQRQVVSQFLNNQAKRFTSPAENARSGQSGIRSRSSMRAWPRSQSST